MLEILLYLGTYLSGILTIMWLISMVFNEFFK